jgi:hypothetical protein
VTGLEDSYPINDTSIFTIQSVALEPSTNIMWFHFGISFKYRVDTDSLNDFGVIEFSPDSGETWINLIDDPVYNNYFYWENSPNEVPDGPPTLTGTSNGWVESVVNMSDLAYYLNIQPGTTFIWKFTFVSDSILDNRDGIIFDNIGVWKGPPISTIDKDGPEKSLVEIIDLMGRKAEKRTNEILIYIYSDGTREKVMILE